VDLRRESYDKAIDLLNALGELYLFQKNNEKVPKETDIAIKINPNYILALKDKGDICLLKGDWNGAIEMYQAAIRHDPHFLEVYIKLGTLYDQLKVPEKAIATFREAISIAPAFAPAYNSAAWLLAREGRDLDEAQKLATKAIELDSTHSDAYDTLGWIYYLIGKFDDAIQALQKAQDMAGDQPHILAHLALVYYEKGMKNDALSVLKKAIAFKKDPPDASSLQKAVTELENN
jgi:tetratricopeptide (TPR) repeat protein